MQTNFSLVQKKNILSSLQDSKIPGDRIILQQKLISPQPYQINRPLITWIQELRTSLAGKNNQMNISGLFNQSAYIFLTQEKFRLAREICYSQIQLFIHESIKAKDSGLLKFVFQPWIHLIQINRLEGNRYDAFNQLNTLENKILKDKLCKSLYDDHELYQLILVQSLLERIRLCLERNHCAELIALIDSEQNRFTIYHECFIQEAKAIAFANNGEIDKAFHVFSSRRTSQYPQLKLRELELRLVLGYPVVDELIILFESGLSMLKTGLFKGYQILFIHHLISILEKAGLSEYSIELAHLVLEVSIRMNDQVLEAESLILLHEIEREEFARIKIEALIKALFFQSHYMAVRRKLIPFLMNSESAEIFNLDLDLTFLYEDLLAFYFQ